MSELEKKLVGYEFVEQEYWGDTLPEQEGIEGKFEGKTFVMNGGYETAYVIIEGLEWQVYYKWIPLCRMNEWNDWHVENWRDLFPATDFFAIPAGVYDDEDAELRGRQKLEALGFATNSFEGF